MPKAVTVDTLGKLRDHRMGLVGHCLLPNCGRSRELKLDVLIDWLGEDFVFINETRISRAFQCDNPEHPKGGKVNVRANTTPPDYNGYAKAKGR